jgi:FAD/FMN-containing dehydrogenase
MVLDSLNMTDIIEYDKENQFITVGSGITLKALQKKLGEENQWLPVRPPFGNGDTTIGSIVSTAAVGPERLAYGAPRDLLLGLQYIDSSGSMVSTGGKVLKNVAGYDMTRLLTGSLGTLGLITESTWKTGTRPEICKKINASGSFSDCFEVALKVVNSYLQAALVTISPEGAEANLSVGFEGLARVVDSQVERCSDVMKGANLTLGDAREYPLLEGYLGPVYTSIWSAPFVLQADVIIKQGADFSTRFSRIAKPSALLLDAAHGRVYAGLDGLTGEQWKEIDALAAQAKGHCKLLKAPESFAGEYDLFGSSRPEWRLSHAVKNALDPQHLFAPGLLPGRV